jgi:hypothetical protein
MPLGDQRFRANQLLRGVLQLALPLQDLGTRLDHVLLGLGDAGAGGGQGGAQLGRVHAGQNLPLRDHVALVHYHLGHASGIPGGDLDLLGLDAAVAAGDVVGKLVMVVAPPEITGGAGHERDKNQDKEKTLTHSGPFRPARQGCRRHHSKKPGPRNRRSGKPVGRAPVVAKLQ